MAVLDTRLGPAAFQVDRGAALAQIDRLEIVANSQPLSRVIEEALRLVGQSELERKEVYVFTDLAEAAWPPEAASRVKSRLEELQRGSRVRDRRRGGEAGELRPGGPAAVVASVFHAWRPEPGYHVANTPASRNSDRCKLYLLDSARKPQKRNEQVVKTSCPARRAKCA